MLFIENVGQFAPEARFQAWGGPGMAWLAEDALWITLMEKDEGGRMKDENALPRPKSEEGKGEGQLPRPESGEGSRRVLIPDNGMANQNSSEGEGQPRKVVNLKLSFVGANPHPRLEPFNRLEAKVSYFLGDAPEKWYPDVPVWGGVRYVDLYPGIDLLIGKDEGGRMKAEGSFHPWPWRLVVRDGAALQDVADQREPAGIDAD